MNINTKRKYNAKRRLGEIKTGKGNPVDTSRGSRKRWLDGKSKSTNVDGDEVKIDAENRVWKRPQGAEKWKSVGRV